MKEYLKLNNEVLNTYKNNGKIDRDKDKEATRKYFLEEVNVKLRYFIDLEEKLKYLVNEGYYEKDFLEQYDSKFIKKVFKKAYAYNFRFPSFMSASKFYEGYAMKSRDGKEILEKYEDRVAITSLYLARGNKELALDAIEAIMTAYQSATPTTLNSGKKARGELVSCFKLTMDDSMNSIAENIGYCLELSRLGGGVGTNLTDLRPLGDPIKGIHNRASGVIPVAKLLEMSFSYSNQLGQRQGSGVVYLNIFHADIENFISAKKPNADEKIRLATLSTGAIIPDIFFKLMQKDKDIVLFSPYDIKKEYGKRMSEISMTDMYYELLDNPNIRKIKRLNARKLYTEIKKAQFESGYPFEINDDNVNNAHPLKGIGRVKMSNLCVTGDTLILTDNGYKKAKDLYTSQEDLKVIIDNRTKQFKQTSLGVSTVNAIPMQLTAKQADVFKIKTKQGFEIKSTKWHKYYILDKNGIIHKKPLNELSVGDKILVQSGEGSYGNNSDAELAYLMGVICGDGTLTDESAKIYLYDNKRVLKDKIENIVSNVIARHKVDRNYKHNANFEPTFNKSNEVELLSFSSTPLLDILKSFGYSRENKLSVPKYVLNGTKEVQLAFLSGLYQMDGTVNANHKAKALTIELVSINKKLLQDIQMLLINVGIYSTVYNNSKRGFSLLPDGKGGQKEYKVKPTYKLSVQDRVSRELFVNMVELKDYDMYKFNLLTSELQYKSRKPKHKYTAEITEIEYYGIEDVYDTTQPDYHSLIFNGIVTGNCTEILQVQQTSLIHDQDKENEYGLDVSCNLGSLDIHEATKVNSFEKLVNTAMRLLTSVSEMTDIVNVPSVAKANKLMHSVGLGAMNLHGHLVTQNILYGSKDSVTFIDKFMEAVNYYSLKSSMLIAKEKGETFYQYEKSDYATGVYFDKYVNKSNEDVNEVVKKALGNTPIITSQMWKELKEDVAKYGVFHSYRLATAPTGSISYIRNCTASLQPVTERVEVRDYGDSRTIYPMPFLTNDNQHLFIESYEMDMYKMIDVYSAAQQHIDQGISMTLYVTNQWTTEQLAKVYIYAWLKNIKSVYYVRQRLQSLEECLSCSI